MEFSNMLKRCKLSEISDYFLDLGQSLIEKEDLDYETAIRNMECRTERLFNTKTPEAVTASGVDFSEITEIISLSYNNAV